MLVQFRLASTGERLRGNDNLREALRLITLEESYAFCEKIARSRAKNFYYSFVLLDKSQKRAMCAVYAFMRYCDDLSDDETNADRRGSIEAWKADLTKALAGNSNDHPLWPALCDALARYRVPREYLFEMIEGVSSDLEPRRVRTFDELYRYCYQVASVVGLTIVHIFGFDDPRALELAEKCGIAFQLTNIIRDIREDEGLNRVYLPADELARFGVADFAYSPAFFEFMRFQGERAREYYEESAELVGMVHARSRASLWALIAIYSRLLKRIEASGYRVLDGRIRLASWEKVWIVVQAIARRS